MNQRQPFFGASAVRDSDRTVESMDWSGGDAVEQLVTLDDAIPTSFGKRGCQAVLGRNAGLGVVPREHVSLRRTSQPRQADIDLILRIPT